MLTLYRLAYNDENILHGSHKVSCGSMLACVNQNYESCQCVLNFTIFGHGTVSMLYIQVLQNTSLRLGSPRREI